MTNPTASAGGDAVARLVAERERYEAWLAALESRRANTPAHIYERVRADYEARLRNVAAQLGEHRASVQAMADSVLQRLSSLEADERQRRDDLTEAELRAAIGELDAEQYRATARRNEESIASLSGERTRLSDELG